MRHERVGEYATGDADLVYGKAEDGKIVHISAVPSGLSCKCRCPACDAVLVARKGEVLAHCFAHHSGTACAAAGETALHKLAKEIIERELRLHLPKLTVEVEKKTIMIHRGGEHRFDIAILERAHKEIIPDVMVWHGDRMLCIEVYVTHPCGSEKRDFFRAESLAALEIDLSTFPRQSTPEAVELAVLKTAKRSWIFNPVRERREREMREQVAQERAAAEEKAAKEREAAKRKAEQKRAVAEEKARRARTHIVDQYQAGLTALSGKKQPTLRVDDPIKRLKLDEFLGRPVAGYACFLSTPFGWQLNILQELIRRHRAGDHPASAVDLLNLLIERNCVRNDFRDVNEEMERTIASCGAAYRSPYQAVDFFLQFLTQHNVLAKHSNEFAITTDVSQKLQGLADQDRRVFERRDRVIQLATNILDRVLPEYRGEMTTSDWFEQEIADHGISFSEAIESNFLKYHKMLTVLENIHAMFFKGGAICPDTLDLPVSEARELEVDKRRLAEIETRRRKEEADRLAGQARRVDVSHKVFSTCQKEGPEWMEKQRSHFGSVDMLDAVERSEDDYYRALKLIDREIARRR